MKKQNKTIKKSLMLMAAGFMAAGSMFAGGGDDSLFHHFDKRGGGLDSIGTYDHHKPDTTAHTGHGKWFHGTGDSLVMDSLFHHYVKPGSGDPFDSLAHGGSWVPDSLHIDSLISHYKHLIGGDTTGSGTDTTGWGGGGHCLPDSLHLDSTWSVDGMKARTRIYPCPAIANNAVNIMYTLDQNSSVLIGVTDQSGRKIGEIENTTKLAGNYLVQWTNTNVPAGIYFISINNGSKVSIQKVFIQ